MDIINNSKGKNYIELSPKVFNAIKELKDLNIKDAYIVPLEKYSYD